MNNGIERRDFIKQGIGAGVTAAAADANILGANDRVRVGVIGVGRQGRGVMKTFMKNTDAQIVAICDVFQPQMDFAINDARLEGVEAYKDFRKILDRKDVDAVIVATPDHWHALKGRNVEAQRVKNENKQGDAHVRNFLDCVKSRQRPTSDIEIGHRSTTTCLLGNVALRSGRRIVWNAKTERIEGDNAASKYLSREYRGPWRLNV